VKGTPVEITETVAPLIFRRKEFRPDTGGPGRQRGGLGQVLEIESAIGADFELLAAFDRLDHPARGRQGGGNGAHGGVHLASGKVLRGKGVQTVPAGERLVIHTPGGAGFGDPHERAREAVRTDCRKGLVSAEAARSSYGLEDA
jgi:N-methylhydantoinase B